MNWCIHFYSIREEGGSAEGGLNFSIIFWFRDFTSDFREMGPFRPIFGNFDQNQTPRKQTSDKSFYFELENSKI